MELLYPLYRLGEEGVAVTVAGLDDNPVTGKEGHGPVAVDTTVDRLSAHDFDGIVIPGGFDAPMTFDEAEIRAAERSLETALEAPDPTAWVYEYTEDAVFDAGGDHAVQGREALLEMATAMKPMSSVAIRPVRTEGSGDLAVVWFEASWAGGAQDPGPTVDVRGMILWRKEADGRWRVTIEHIA